MLTALALADRPGSTFFELPFGTPRRGSLKSSLRSWLASGTDRLTMAEWSSCVSEAWQAWQANILEISLVFFGIQDVFRFYFKIVAIPCDSLMEWPLWISWTRHDRVFAFRRSSERYGTQESTEKKRPKGMAHLTHLTLSEHSYSNLMCIPKSIGICGTRFSDTPTYPLVIWHSYGSHNSPSLDDLAIFTLCKRWWFSIAMLNYHCPDSKIFSISWEVLDSSQIQSWHLCF